MANRKKIKRLQSLVVSKEQFPLFSLPEMEVDADPGELDLTLMQSLQRSLKETFVAVDPNDNLTLSIRCCTELMAAPRNSVDYALKIFTTSWEYQKHHPQPST